MEGDGPKDEGRRRDVYEYNARTLLLTAGGMYSVHSAHLAEGEQGEPLRAAAGRRLVGGLGDVDGALFARRAARCARGVCLRVDEAGLDVSGGEEGSAMPKARL